MFLSQDLVEYLDNPMGKGNSAITNKKLIQEDLNKRYNKLIKKHKDFKYVIYKSKDSYYIHFKIPSETERGNDYDVVLKFYPDFGTDLKYNNYLGNYTLKFFSNSPSFIFTYAYVYNKSNRLISELNNKYSTEVLQNKPVVRNPNQVLGYEKSVYFACLYMKNHKELSNKMILNANSTTYIPNIFKESIRDTDTILKEIEKADKELKTLPLNKKPGVVDRLLGKNKDIVKKTTNTNVISGINKIKPKSKIYPIKGIKRSKIK
jgi:hypothetical protein